VKILVWNLRRGNKKSESWKIILNYSPDVCLLQEVSSIHESISEVYQVLEKYSTNKNLEQQKFKSVSLIKKDHKYSISNFSFSNPTIENIYNHFKGNLIGFKCNGYSFINIYSPPWGVPESLFKWSDVEHIKLKKNHKLWITEVVYDIVKSSNFSDQNLIFGGDFNHSIKFDFGNKGNRGNQEIINRFHRLNYFDSLGEFNGGLIPTFQNPRGKELIHQIDYLYIHKSLIKKINRCSLIEKRKVLNRNLSDHLPILLELKNSK